MEHSPEDENSILAEMRVGNEAAYQSVFYCYYEQLCLYVLNFIPDKSKAEDIVQEVFVKLWDKRETLHLNGSLKAYLYKMTYYEFVETFRKEKRYQKELDEFKIQALAPLIEESEELWQQRLNRLKEAIDSLPPRCREIFLLSKQDGIRQKEIAKKLNISVKTVEGQITKAMAVLKKQFTSKEIYLLMLIRRPFVLG